LGRCGKIEILACLDEKKKEVWSVKGIKKRVLLWLSYNWFCMLDENRLVDFQRLRLKNYYESYWGREIGIFRLK